MSLRIGYLPRFIGVLSPISSLDGYGSHFEVNCITGEFDSVNPGVHWLSWLRKISVKNAHSSQFTS